MGDISYHGGEYKAYSLLEQDGVLFGRQDLG